MKQAHSLDQRSIQGKIKWIDILNAIPKPNTAPKWEYWVETYPELKACKHTDQDPIYHGEGDVWTHTQMVVSSMIKSQYYKRSSNINRAILFLSALLHDIAKPITTTIDPKTHRIGHPNHSPIGAIMVRILLSQQDFPFNIREEICNLIHNHQKPFYLMLQKHPLHTLYKLSWEVSLSNLIALARADIKGRINEDNPINLKRLKKLQTFIQQSNCYHQPAYFNNSLSRRIFAYTKTGLLSDIDIPNNTLRVTLILKLADKSSIVTQIKSNDINNVIESTSFQNLRQDPNASIVINSMYTKAEQFIKLNQNFTWIVNDLSKLTRHKIITWLYKFNVHISVIYVEPNKDTLLDIIRLDNIKSELNSLMSLEWDVPKPWESDQIDYHFMDS
ncbi:HD domain-containing protein [Thorsellia anophelis]|uniref:HD domain-containing protein n=1 Tax=Thorsellia anophelis DSM 18579 TaxID=1123402 RepID=A0A1I0CUC2_9GAMM|nr:HD domain-containing protein [Thorsellia anophelis]SET23384.1 HD domain-containing protein [Thorsellia anophelis DSM 18579]